MTTLKIKTQAQLDKAISDGVEDVEFIAKGTFEINCRFIRVSVNAELKWDVSLIAWGSSSVVARESSRVEAWESSRVEAWGSSSVVARESSSVVAWGSSSVVAWGSSSVVAWGSSSVVAKGFVSLSLWGKAKAGLSLSCHAFIHSKEVSATGGKQTKVIIDTPKKWCEYYGVEVKGSIAILYKGVNAEYRSNRVASFQYLPGTIPVAPDWDGGKQECGGGLHFSPHPHMVKEFLTNPKHYLACPVALKDIAIHMDGSYPQKCKARGLCEPCWEVDQDGNRLSQGETV